MLYYSAQSGMTSPQAGTCTKLVLRDTNTKEIICFAVCMSEDTYIVGKRGDDNFEKYIKVLKLDDADHSHGSESPTTDNAE